MSAALEIFGLRRKSDWLTPSHSSFRPPSWPPPRDWVVSEDRNGKALSVWGDPVWDISPWAGRSVVLNFGDGARSGKSAPLDSRNADLLRMLTTWRIWGIKSCATAGTLRSVFQTLRRIVALCSENNILASDLMRFPAVFDQVSGVIPASEYAKTMVQLHKIWDAREHIGFVIVDREGLKRLAIAAPDHEVEQRAYIPPRIWTYQVQRLKACLDDYLAHKTQIEGCFNFCVDAYAQNHGSLEAALAPRAGSRSPFRTPAQLRAKSLPGFVSHGPFGLTAERFGIAGLIEKWIGPAAADQEVRYLSAYLSLVQGAGLAFITNFTLQRINEAAELRSDCLSWESDEKLGRVPIITGETTKTDRDSDARWPTSPSVALAVEAAASVAKLRMRCAAADPLVRPDVDDVKNPYLFGGSYEPWAANRSTPYYVRPNPGSYKKLVGRYTRLLDENELRITEEDLRLARMLTPNLSEENGFAVGSIWPLGWHQLRRTGAVNMFTSAMLSDSSLQFLMKHASRLMPLYYGRGFTKLLLNQEVEGVIVEEMYQAMGRKLQVAVGERFVSPLGRERKEVILVNLVSEKNCKELVLAARRGLVHFREMRVGACARRGTCPYGGIESVSRCTGGDGGGPCADALYDREKAPAIERELAQLNLDIGSTPANSPRHKALLAERQGLENYLNVVGR